MSAPQYDVLRAKVTGDRDPGYGSTGKMIGQAAASIVLDNFKSGKKSGRVAAFGPRPPYSINASSSA